MRCSVARRTAKALIWATIIGMVVFVVSPAFAQTPSPPVGPRVSTVSEETRTLVPIIRNVSSETLPSSPEVSDLGSNSLQKESDEGPRVFSNWTITALSLAGACGLAFLGLEVYMRAKRKKDISPAHK